ncbi:MAG: hypothetical protein QOI13_1110 [Paraburkholderia sp.]|nr:hypothetical protein [Paraburkholderia sp.]
MTGDETVQIEVGLAAGCFVLREDLLWRHFGNHVGERLAVGENAGEFDRTVEFAVEFRRRRRLDGRRSGVRIRLGGGYGRYGQ